MSANRDHFDSFDDHTLLKHAILRSYLFQWASIHLRREGGGGRHPRVVFVDGFAGEGRDREGHDGSPIIAARVASDVRGAPPERKLVHNARMRVGAVESDPARFRAMSQSLAVDTEDAPLDFMLREGSFADHVEELCDWAGGFPTLWFLDPFGVKGLEARWYSKLLAGHHKNEIFVLAANVGAVRLAGVLRADADRLERELQSIATSPSFFPEEDSARVAYLDATRESLHRQLNIEDPAARDILVAALGDPACISKLGSVDIAQRPATYLQLFCDALRNAGASVQLRVPIRDVAGRPMHVLVHASQNLPAMVTMKKAVSEGLGLAQLHDAMRDRLKLELRVPSSVLVDDLCRVYAGRALDWANTRDGRPLSRIIVESTAAFHFQLQEIKEELIRRKLRTKDGRIEVIQFPTTAE